MEDMQLFSLTAEFPLVIAILGLLVVLFWVFARNVPKKKVYTFEAYQSPMEEIKPKRTARTRFTDVPQRDVACGECTWRNPDVCKACRKGII